ncbi:MAG: tripartite tricarboxylate transporter substrate binding protein [Burkholderiales bacterium]|nr:tripartite tricarboxylate transporter substrate binding protein [Burkholderiales bacterium]
MSNRRDILALACAASLAPLASPAAAQEWPKKTLTILVGFAPGGAVDHAARIVAKKLTENLGQNVVVENKAGAGGNIAHQAVATAEPDGSTILLGSVGPLAIAPHLMKLPYDAQKDIAPLTLATNFASILVVPPQLGVKTLSELLALARRDGKAMNFGSTGPGSASHLAGELFNARAGTEVVHIPYKGGAPAVNELLAGRLSMYFATMSTAGPHIATGRMIALATTGTTRAPFLPDVPAVAEVLPGFTTTNWYAFVASARIPAPILERWNQELVKALKSPDVEAEMTRAGMAPAPTSREELARFIDSESKLWAKVIAERKITVQ